MFPPVDTKDPAAVAEFVIDRYRALFPGSGSQFLEAIFRDTVTLFQGGHDDYQAIDLRYHDLEHTLQATLCLALLMEGCNRSGEGSPLSAREFELGVAAALLHDSGYLKNRSDLGGTGAKYTYCHVLRSCAYAASYLPRLNVTDLEMAGILGAINCTGPTKDVRTMRFRDTSERFIGSALATADYLGQMAAPDYPDELEYLYTEFSESEDYLHVPLDQRPFRSAEDLITRTPGFWHKVVLPKLENDYQRTYRFLADPFPLGRNDYMSAVQANIALIEARIAERARLAR